MGVFTYETEYTSVIPPARLFNALFLDIDNLIPKIAPQAIKTVEILEGDGGVGTIKKVSFGEGSEYNYIKHKVEGIDKDNFVYNYSLIEGDVISDKLEKISYEIKLVASGTGSSIKNISHYHTKGDVEIKEEHVKAGKDKTLGILVLQEVVLNQLKEVGGLLFASLNMLFLDLNISLGVIVAGALDDATAAGSHQLSLVTDFLNCFGDSISLNHTVLIHKVVLVNSIDSVLDIVVCATFTEIDLLNGSNSAISFKDLSALHCLWCNLGDEVVSIKNKGIVQPSGGDDGVSKHSLIIMGVFTYETEFTSVCAPGRLYNALVLDADNLIPKIAPQAVKTAEILEGDGGVGTIKKISFGEGSEYSYVKHKVDGIDKDNFVYNYSLIEGDVISDKIEKISYETKLVASGSGSVIKSTSHYHTKGDVEIKEEHVKAGKERAHEVVLNQLEEVGGLFFASLNMLFLDLNISFGVIVASALDDTTATGSHQLSLVTYFLNCFGDSISLNHTVLIHKVVLVNSIDSVLDIAVCATFTEVDLLNGSNSAISFKDLSALHCLWCNLRDEVVSIKNKGIVQPNGGDDGGELEFLSIITMGVFTYETEFASVCAPARLYNALVLDADNLIPKIAPQAVKTAEILEGDGGVGTIKKISFGEGSEYSYVKHKVDGIDKDNFLYSYSLIEGDVISDKIEKISYETKLVASGSGSVIKSTSHYHTKGDVEIKEEHVKAGKERAHGLFKLIENYLVANPDAYN
ncbi:unnamed protein product [Malus baccata var. baccata]